MISPPPPHTTSCREKCQQRPLFLATGKHGAAERKKRVTAVLELATLTDLHLQGGGVLVAISPLLLLLLLLCAVSDAILFLHKSWDK